MRVRLEAAARGLERRTHLLLPAWRAMLATLEGRARRKTEFADGFEIARDDARDADVGFERHWIDPTYSHSPEASLNRRMAVDHIGRPCATPQSWANHEGDWRRCGGCALAPITCPNLHNGSLRLSVRLVKPSAILVVRDIDRRDYDQLAGRLYASCCLRPEAADLSVHGRRRRSSHACADRIASGPPPVSRSMRSTWDALDTGRWSISSAPRKMLPAGATDALRAGSTFPDARSGLRFDKVPWPKPASYIKRGGRGSVRPSDDLLARLR